ncbi:uncharacterized protein UTRI_06342 [Ustilago trichophora]|uniref:Uncharacterized protein n=1 Tax=Ustilago trichophora TaxID=86804 RepID=A0A5C3EJ06_9BASI|nr:uncharacterized protein UTRI_06342 [Ustilago trichophora]
MKSASEVAVRGREQRSWFECVRQDQRSVTGGQRIGKPGRSELPIVFRVSESAYGAASKSCDRKPPTVLCRRWTAAALSGALREWGGDGNQKDMVQSCCSQSTRVYGGGEAVGVTTRTPNQCNGHTSHSEIPGRPNEQSRAEQSNHNLGSDKPTIVNTHTLSLWAMQGN